MVSMPMKKCIIPILLFVIAAEWLTWNLGGQELGMDEPDTFIIARNTARTGWPMVWDGKYFMSLINGADSIKIGDKLLWRWHPWLQHYVGALPIRLGFDNPAATRLPFALAGALTVAVSYWLAREIFENDTTATLMALQLAVTMPFFLYMRQMRYYALIALFSTIIFWMLARYLKKGLKGKETYLLAGATAGLLASNYLAWVGTMGCMFLLWIYKKRNNRGMLVILAIEGIAAAVWYLVIHPFNGNLLMFGYAGKSLLTAPFRYLSYINAYLFPLILAPVIWVVRGNPAKWLKPILILVGLKIMFSALFLGVHGRLLVDIMPVILLPMGYIYQYWGQKSSWLAVVAWVIFSLTNWINILPITALRPEKAKAIWYPSLYKYELTGTYPSSIREISSYLKQNYQKGDLLWVSEYGFSFYIYSGLPQFSPLCNVTTGLPQGPDTITDKNKIKWLVFFPHDRRYPQDLKEVGCLGKEMQDKLATDYHIVKLKLGGKSYLPNDGDIVNRQFPPLPATEAEYMVYERND
jgi:hypothetical protein